MTTPGTTPPPDAGQPEMLCCPFCGATPKPPTAITDIHFGPMGQHIACFECNFFLTRTTDQEVIAAWNRRAPLAPSRALTEADVDAAIEAYFTFHNEYFVDDTDDHWTSGVYRHGDVTNQRFWGPGEKRDARDWLEQAAKQAARAALNAPARVDARDWEGEYKALSHALVGDTGASAILVASQLREQINAIIPAAGFFDPEDEDQIFEVALKYSENFHAMKRELAEMRDICGGEVGEITRTPEADGALERAMGDVGKDDGNIPKFLRLADKERAVRHRVLYQALAEAECIRQNISPEETISDRGDEAWELVGYEAALKYLGGESKYFAAIEAARERGDG